MIQRIECNDKSFFFFSVQQHERSEMFSMNHGFMTRNGDRTVD